MDWTSVVATFLSGLVGEWVALGILSTSLEVWRRRKSNQMRVQRRIKRHLDEARVSVTLTQDQVLMLQACVQALALQAEAEMKVTKAEALHELDRELVQTLGRMATRSVIGMMDAPDIMDGDSRLG